jgi:hypothetical protein
MFEEILNAIGDSLSNPSHSDDMQDGEEEAADEEDADLSKLSDDDEPRWVMGTISKTVRHCIESFRQKQMRHDRLMQLGWGDAANYLGRRDMKYRTAELMVMAVVKHQIDTNAAPPSLTILGEQTHTVEIFHGQSHMSAVTSQPGSDQMRLC